MVLVVLVVLAVVLEDVVMHYVWLTKRDQGLEKTS